MNEGMRGAESMFFPTLVFPGMPPRRGVDTRTPASSTAAGVQYAVAVHRFHIFINVYSPNVDLPLPVCRVFFCDYKYSKIVLVRTSAEIQMFW